MTKLKKLSDLKPSPQNPRIISPEALKGLKASLKEFGDISGIVFNEKTGNLVGAHQRIKAFREECGDLEIPDKRYSVGKDTYYFFITPEGKAFPIRTVKWSRRKERAANLSANNEYTQGAWTPELGIILNDLGNECPDLVRDLRLEPLGDDIPQIPEPDNDTGTSESKEEWVKCVIGEKIVGVIHKDVALLFYSEYDRIAGIIESEEITPVIEAITANSAGTPEESLL